MRHCWQRCWRTSSHARHSNGNNGRSFFGPPGIVIGGAAGLIIAGISGAILGGKAGTELGAMIDNNILKNYKCMDCHHTFSESNSQLESASTSELTSEIDEGDTFQLPPHHNHIHLKE